jgi:putative ATP-dependent endonuclease of OLD family
VTTHSPAVISVASQASLWYVDHTSKIGSLDSKKIAMLRTSEPEAFFTRLTVVAEGASEVGFVGVILEKALGSPLIQHGVYVANGGGNETTLNILEAFAKGGLSFGGFVDDEGKNPTRWEKVAEVLGSLLFRWTSGYLEENVFKAVPDDKLEALICDPANDKTGIRLRTLADRLDIQEKSFEAVRTTAGPDLRAVILAAASGNVPVGKEADKKQFQAHAQSWFKTIGGGRELAAKLFSLDAWPTLRPEIMPFCNAVQRALGLPESTDIAP